MLNLNLLKLMILYIIINMYICVFKHIKKGKIHL